jgi:hypothetical protein
MPGRYSLTSEVLSYSLNYSFPALLPGYRTQPNPTPHLNPSQAQATASIKILAKMPKNASIEDLYKTEVVIIITRDGLLLSVATSSKPKLDCSSISSNT